MKEYKPGEHVIYEKDGARAIVEVMERKVEGEMETYKLRVTAPVKACKPIFTGGEGSDKANHDSRVNYERRYKIGQELNVGRNMNEKGSCWGMWTLTDIIDEAQKPNSK